MAPADLGDPSLLPAVGRSVQGGLKGPKSRGHSPYLLNPVRSNVQRPTALETQTEMGLRAAGSDIRGLDVVRSTNIGVPVDKPGKSLRPGVPTGQVREDYLPMMQRGATAQQGLTTGRLIPYAGIDKDSRNPISQNIRDLSILPNQKLGKNCNKGLSDQLGLIQQSELMRAQGLGSQFPLDKSSKYHGHAALQSQGEGSPHFQQPLLPLDNMRSGVFSPTQHQGQGLPAEARDLGLMGKSTDKLQVPQTRISIGIESSHGAPNLRIQGVEGNKQPIPVAGGRTHLGLSLAEEQKSISKQGKHPFHDERDVREPKALPGSTGDNTQGASKNCIMCLRMIVFA